jgi:hypothetical protein
MEYFHFQLFGNGIFKWNTLAHEDSAHNGMNDPRPKMLRSIVHVNAITSPERNSEL